MSEQIASILQSEKLVVIKKSCGSQIIYFEFVLFFPVVSHFVSDLLGTLAHGSISLPEGKITVESSLLI